MRELSVFCIMNVLFHQTPKPSNIHQPKQIYIIIIYLLYMQICIFVLGNYFWKHKLGALVFWIFNFLCDISRVLNRYLINWNKTEWKNAQLLSQPFTSFTLCSWAPCHGDILWLPQNRTCPRHSHSFCALLFPRLSSSKRVWHLPMFVSTYCLHLKTIRE